MFASRTNWDREKNALAIALDDARRAGKQIIDLAASNPTHVGFMLDARSILAALSDPAALAYNPDPLGLPSARSAVVDYYAARGDSLSLDDILLTASTSEAYSFLFRALCDPGAEILVPAPGYPLFDFLAAIQDVRVVRYPLVYDHGWQVDFHALEGCITPQTRAVIVVHPNNPTGHFTKRAELAQLNRLAAAHRLALVADEVFWDFQFDARAPFSFAVNREVLTFTLSGISKICGLPQMKAAWIVAQGPEDLKKEALERLEIVADTYLSVGAPVQHALPHLLAMREDFQRQLIARVRHNLAALDRSLKNSPGVTRLEMEGGWYAVLLVPVTRTDEDLAIALLRETGVYLHPGHFYDFPGEGNFVVSLIPREEEFTEGIRALLSLV
ncbi:MAG TPA: pyridoxal phosphate-dependent aminotransferase [Candidatus Acidoferrum sp.]|nr:pyridoxal phosphate-dependent aminotransferase [Candidatus Acidoferrum sp.]